MHDALSQMRTAVSKVGQIFLTSVVGFLAIFLFFTAATPSADAALCSFSGTSTTPGNNFNDATNWDCGRVPIAGDTAVIPANTSTQIGSGTNFSFDHLHVSGTLNMISRNIILTAVIGTVSVDTAGVVTSTDGGLYASSTVTIYTGGVVSSTSGVLTFDGDVTSTAARLTTDTGELYVGGNMTNNSGGVVTSTSGSITVVGTFTNNGSLGNNEGIVAITGALTNVGTVNAPGGLTGFMILSGNFNNTGGTFNHNGGTVTLNGGGGATLTSVASVYNLSVTKTGGSSVAVAGSHLAVANELSTNGNNFLNLTDRNLTVTGASTIGATTAVTSTSGLLTFAAVTNNGTVTSTSGTITATTFANNSLLGNNEGAITITGALTNVGTVNAPVAAGSMTLSSNFDNTGGTFNHNGGTLTLAGSAGATLTSVAGVYSLSVTKTGGSSVAVAGSDLAVANALTLSSGAGGNFLNLTSRNLTVTGASTIGATTAVTSTSGNIFLAAVTNAGAITSATGMVRATGAVGNSGTMTLTGAGSMRFQDVLTNTGTVDFGSGVASTTAAVNNNSGGTININSSHATTTATWTNSSGGTVDLGTGTLEFNDAAFTNSGAVTPGTGLVMITGSASAAIAGTTYNSVLIGKTADAVVTFGANTTLSGNLETTGANETRFAGSDLVVGGNTTLAAGTSINSTSGALTFGNNAAVDTFSNLGTVSSTSGLLKFVSGVTNNASSYISVGTGAISFDGSVSNSGNVHVNAGNASTTNASLPFTNVSGGTFHLGTGHVTTTGALYNNSGATVAGPGSVLAFMGNFNNAGTFSPVADSDFVVYYSGSASVTSSGTISFANLFVDKTGGATLTFTASPTVNGTFITSGSHAVEVNNQDFIALGASTIGSGTMVTSTSGNLRFASLSTLASGAVSSTSGRIIATGVTTNAGSIATTGGVIRLEDAVTNSGTISFGTGVASTTATLANTGNIYIQGASVTTTGAWTNSSAGTINGGTGTLQFSDAAFTNAAGATFTAGTGRVYQVGTAAVNMSGATYYDLVIGKTGSVAVTMTSSTVVGNTLTTTGANTLNAVATNLSVTGASTIGSGSTVTSTSGTLTFTGAVSNSGSIGTISGNQLYSSTLTNVGGSSVLRIGSGTATTTGALTNPGTIYGGTGLLSVVDAWTNSGTFTRGTGAVRFVGTAGQTIPAVTFYDLTVRTTGGDAELSGYTSVSGTLTVVTSTTLAIDTNTLNAPGTYLNSGTVSRSTGSIIHPNSGYEYTDSSGTTVTSVAEGSGVVYLTLTDANRNLLGGTIETISVVGTVGGDSVTVTLTETGASTGIFRNATGATLGSSCAPDPANTTFEVIAASGSLASTYTDSVDSSDATTDTTAFTATAPVCGTVSSGGGGGGGTSAGSGGGSSSSAAPLPTSFPTNPTPTPSPAPAPAPAPTPASAPSSGPSVSIEDFVRLGTTQATVRLGSGERGAIYRDLMDTLGEGRVTVVDMERSAAGQIPLQRNLTREREQLPRVRATFRSMYGRDPIFSNPEENLAWNTLMYRIRFPRDLTLEREGIVAFRRIFRRTPQDPLQWATVRVLGYVR